MIDWETRVFWKTGCCGEVFAYERRSQPEIQLYLFSFVTVFVCLFVFSCLTEVVCISLLLQNMFVMCLLDQILLEELLSQISSIHRESFLHF